MARYMYVFKSARRRVLVFCGRTLSKTLTLDLVDAWVEGGESLRV